MLLPSPRYLSTRHSCKRVSARCELRRTLSRGEISRLVELATPRPGMHHPEELGPAAFRMLEWVAAASEVDRKVSPCKLYTWFTRYTV